MLQFKITLDGISPRIWRRIVVPVRYSFFDFHVAIQNAMGWTDSHLHAFRLEQKGTRRPITIRYPNPEGIGSSDNSTLDERTEKIADHFGKTIKQCVYEYDFGDSWSHSVLFEDAGPAAPGVTYPTCIAGENACPPEDSGGPSGYASLRKIMKNPKHPEHAEMVEWLGLDDASEFDPTAFAVQEVVFQDPKARLMEYKRGFGF